MTEASPIEICGQYPVDERARALLRDGMAAREFIEALLASRLHLAGVDFLAHAMPARQAIWWGCLCLQHASGDNLTPADRIALAAAVQWVLQPTEENRAAAEGPAKDAGNTSAAGALARAANWTGGPLIPAKAVATAVKLAAVKVQPVKIAGTQRLFVELGIGVAEGRYPKERIT